jgi:hypothetical protein
MSFGHDSFSASAVMMKSDAAMNMASLSLHGLSSDLA